MLKVSELIAQLEDLRATRGDLFIFQSSDDEGNKIRNVCEVSMEIHGEDDDEDQVAVAIIWPGWTDLEEWTP